MGFFANLCAGLLAMSLALCLVFAQESYPTYSEMDLPKTSFSCWDKVNGAYYADIETDCQMYHVCHRDKNGKTKSTRFLCGNGTVFDQRHLVCQDYRKVKRCQDSTKYYNNVVTLLERLEAKLRSGETEKKILEVENFEFERLN
ncbi:U-scoloptoxin(01)-Er1a-like [Argiope bruennichi]|uniref:U-scoloptoxin(01)-Cw1a like protein n=1 Tax=Argiope bruennichi TaxID=94029 RepID=A0A8T0DZH9_ARGBR|nr:U-scoloptoxin(01)-Er1a-like [Argiope bruennichi]KAF8763185.1 U-scoloptoxin(01)-Cw1a like protein [Argiope bruennichi]